MKKKQSRAHESERLFDLTRLEREAKNKGFSCIAGVDEAGRGPLAGPVVAAACVFKETLFFEGINDSKLLTPLKRKRLFCALSSHPGIAFAIGIVDVEEIDRINILQASLQAMRLALSQLEEQPDYLLTDGNRACGYHGVIEQAVVGGDRLSQSIAAASILAKETRDEIMREYHQLYPQYGFHAHKGYGTKQHLKALAEFGATPIHRRSFLPVKGV